MARLIEARLTIIGTQRRLERLDGWNWSQRLRAKYVEVWEHSKTRRVWLFQTHSRSPQDHVRSLSVRWPGLVFLLEYDDQRGRRKGLVKAVQGKVDHCEFSL